MAQYSLDLDRPMPYLVVGIFDDYEKEGVYGGSYEDCLAFLEEQGITYGYKIVQNWKNNVQ